MKRDALIDPVIHQLCVEACPFDLGDAEGKDMNTNTRVLLDRLEDMEREGVGDDLITHNRSFVVLVDAIVTTWSELVGPLLDVPVYDLGDGRFNIYVNRVESKVHVVLDIRIHRTTFGEVYRSSRVRRGRHGTQFVQLANKTNTHLRDIKTAPLQKSLADRYFKRWEEKFRRENLP